MSGTSQAEPRVDPNGTACSAAFAREVLASGMTCASIDRTGVVIEASAALRTIMPSVTGQSVRTAFHIDPMTLFAPDSFTTPIHVKYLGVSGELVPAVLHALYDVPEQAHALLVAVNDGAPFRQAESRRFEASPYIVLRVTSGTIRYANSEAARILRLPPDALIGLPLTELFQQESRDVILGGLDDCESRRMAVPLDVAISGAAGLAMPNVRLLLMPDIAPGEQWLGVLAVVQLTAVDHIRDEIRKIALDPCTRNWREQLRLILSKIRQLIEFDHVTFGIYADNLRLYCAVAIEPANDDLWPARWLELPESIGPWIRAGKTWIQDARAFTDADPQLRDNEVARRYAEFGIQSSVTLPTGGKEGPTCALSLCSRELNKYGEADLRLLRELDLEPVLLRFEEEIRAERDDFSERMRRLFANASSLRIASHEAITEVARHFGWDYVALFRVNRYREQFELVYQQPSKPDYALPPDYVQPICDGMLAATLKSNAVLNVNDIGAQDVEQYGYVSVNRHLRSAMTIPLRLNGRIRWVIDVEAAVTHAFRGPDRESIEKVVELIEKGLTQRMLAEMRERLLHETEQGVVVVGLEGAIIEMNEVAARLLGRGIRCTADGDYPVLISSYASKTDPHSLEVLEGRAAQGKRRIELQGDDGKVRAVLATRRELDVVFDTALWFLTDLATIDWSRDLRYLREIVSDVAQQTRAPLTLASTLARQLPRLLPKVQQAISAESAALPDARGMCERLVTEIGKADITFERLAEGLSIRKEPMRAQERVDLTQCMLGVLDALPGRDRHRIDTQLPDEPVFVIGDAGRLAFVVRSIVAHLLRNRPGDDTRLIAAVVDDGDQVTLILCSTVEVDAAGEADIAGPRDALWEACREARDDAGIAFDALSDVVDAHGGALYTQPASWPDDKPLPPWTAFRIVLPRAHQREGQP
ncbi:PAS domain-containing protein [Burkholderia ubonensis]|nr:PAS domain-containing protein [Burkholderia ubonensis]